MELWPAAESHASLNLSLFSHAWPVSSFQVGFLANDEASFAAALDAALSLGPEERARLVARARAASEQFSDEAFAVRLREIATGGMGAAGRRLFGTR